MKTIIVSEKPIAGEQISKILSGGKYTSKKDKGSPSFNFSSSDFGDVILIPLKGHISDVDFPKDATNWYKTDVKVLAKETKILYLEKEKAIISLLKKEAKGAQKAIIATDADREGESIGKEAATYLKEGNPKIEIKRAYFSAITKEELSESFSNLKELNYNLADAADARREIDLVWGAVLTRFLSLSTKSTGKSFLSVGRVQSPTLAKIVEKELEIESFKPEAYWEIEVMLEKEKEKFKAYHKKDRFDKEDIAKKIFDSLGQKAKVTKITKTRNEIPKPVPFNTTDFLRASSSIGLDAIKAMEIAEKLYMEGYISYPRTDNQKYIGISIESILNKLNQGELKQNVSKILANDKIVPSQGKETKDHPPIHPVEFLDEKTANKYDYKVYKLIVDRFLATLSSNAVTFVTKAEFDINTNIFVSKGVIIKDKGWIEFYPYSSVKEETLPELNEGDLLDVIDKKLLSKFTKPPARYSQGTLIKLMEDLNLGTKSTRPSIIEKLYSREYISGKKQIKPSAIAKAVVSSLSSHAKEVVAPDMTAALENEMNEIEETKSNKSKVVVDSRIMLDKIVDDLIKNKLEIAKGINSGKYESVQFGVCPKCGSNLKKMKSRNGKWFVGCSGYPKCSNSYPLPQKGEIIFEDKYCEVCKSPKITLKNKGSALILCINPQCDTNKDWREKIAKMQEEAKANSDKLEVDEPDNEDSN